MAAPRDPNTPADAVLLIRATFKEYVSPETFCDYTITPLDKATVTVTKDSDGRPVLRFGRISLHVGHYQKKDTYKPKPEECIPTTIRLEPINNGVARGVFQLKIEVKPREGDPESTYHPIGLVFRRADETDEPNRIGIPYTTAPHRQGNYPFGNVKINEPDGVVEIDMVQTHQMRPVEPPPKHGEPDKRTTHRTCRIWIIIQEARTGKIGIIDPEEEFPNTH